MITKAENQTHTNKKEKNEEVFYNTLRQAVETNTLTREIFEEACKIKASVKLPSVEGVWSTTIEKAISLDWLKAVEFNLLNLIDQRNYLCQCLSKLGKLNFEFKVSSSQSHVIYMQTNGETEYYCPDFDALLQLCRDRIEKLETIETV